MSSEFNIDHVGPVARTVLTNARLLQVIAGYDGTDDRAGLGCHHLAHYRSTSTQLYLATLPECE